LVKRLSACGLSFLLAFALFACASGSGGTEDAGDGEAESTAAVAPQTPRPDRDPESYPVETAPSFEIVQVESLSPEVPFPEGFAYLDTSILLDIRYAGSYNFIGTPIDGYEKPVGILTAEAGAALADANRLAMERGYRLKVYDAYRPYRAHEHFVSWGNDPGDTLMREYFYPDLDKADLFGTYIARYGDPHSSGSTVDLTLVDMKSGLELDMGSHFDLFAPVSQYYSPGIGDVQRANRETLREIMVTAGFVPYDGEWWDFTLAGEPYPNTYFDFPVR
jgi:D-alanyl-D-alanine dipeptidase